MMWQVAIALLMVGVSVASAQDYAIFEKGCWPKWTKDHPRPACDCSKESSRDSWVYGDKGFLACFRDKGVPGMVYRFNPEKLTYDQAKKGCGDWDEAVCEGEYLKKTDQRRWRTGLLNIQFENELEVGVIPAIEKACVTPRYEGQVWFWVAGIDKGKVHYEGSKSGDCLAIRVERNGGAGRIFGRYISCNVKLPSFIRITPVSRH